MLNLLMIPPHSRHDDMEPPLLVRAWMMAHLWGAGYQAMVCCGGSSGEAAFQESLQPQYTSTRHDAKGLRTYYITGTCGDGRISRISSTRIGKEVLGTDGGLLCITVTSNTSSWQEGDLSDNKHLALSLELERLSGFLRGCSNLEHLSLASLHAITVVGGNFLSGCSGLKELDLSALNNVQKVGSYFLAGCSGLTRINLAPLNGVEELPFSFLSGCCNLLEVDLSPFVHVKSVDGYFLLGCSSLKSIDLMPLRSIEAIPHNFLNGCTGLKEVDLSPLVNIRVVGSQFLRNCAGLMSVNVASLHAIEKLYFNFLYGCTSLKRVDLSPLVNLKEVGSSTLSCCFNLSCIVLPPQLPINALPKALRVLGRRNGAAAAIS